MSARADGASNESSLDRWRGALGLGLALLGLFVIVVASVLWVGHASGWAYDFGAYFAAAERLVATGSPYQVETLSGPFRPGPYGLYLYAPPLATAFVPLTILGASTGVMIWLALRVAALIATCALMPISRPLRLATFGIAALSAPVLLDLNLGNVSLLVTFLAVLTWRWLDRPASGVALAFALTVRPTMAVVAVWWLIRGAWRPVAWLIASGLVIVLLTLPFVGVARWFDYVTVLRNVSDVTGVRSNVDLASAALMFGAPSWAASAALYAGYAISLVAVALSLRRDRELSFVVTLMSTLLLSPLLWDHYLTLLLVPAAFLASRGRTIGLVLPLLCWIPTVLVVLAPDLTGVAQAILPIIALAGLLLPFAVPDRGEPAGKAWQRILDGRSIRPVRA